MTRVCCLHCVCFFLTGPFSLGREVGWLDWVVGVPGPYAGEQMTQCTHRDTYLLRHLPTGAWAC